MGIKTLFIDIGEVLVRLDYPTLLKRIKVLSPLSTQEISHGLKGSSDTRLYETGQLSTRAFLSRISRTLRIHASPQDLKQVWGNLFPSGSLISPQFFDELKGRYQLLALSNTNEMHFEYLFRTHPLVSRFHDHVLSYQVGCLKPEPAIYEAALFKAGKSPEEVLFIDDRMENIEGAEQLGIQGILFVDEERLKESLRKRGLI